MRATVADAIGLNSCVELLKEEIAELAKSGAASMKLACHGVTTIDNRDATIRKLQAENTSLHVSAKQDHSAMSSYRDQHAADIKSIKAKDIAIAKLVGLNREMTQ